MFQPSKYQEAVFNWVKEGVGCAMVNAVAGSGKTTTLVQAAEMLPADASKIFLAFNNSIVQELTGRLNGKMECKTIHSVGFNALLTARGRFKVEGNKYRAIIKEATWQLVRETQHQSDPPASDEIHTALTQLTNLCQVTLTNPRDPAAFHSLIVHYGIEIPTQIGETVLGVVISQILSEGKEQAEILRTISFGDMLWLPSQWNVQPPKYDWIFVDECQDLSAAQLAIVRAMMKPTTRAIFVGDHRQAINGFAGADAKSFWNIQEAMQAVVLPLSISYRCPQKIVTMAKEIVAEIEPREGANDGTIETIHEDKFSEIIQPGDMVLCRLSAPLVKICLKLIAQRIPAKVKGQDIGEGLVKIVEKVEKLKGCNFETFPQLLKIYFDRQIEALARVDGNEQRIETMLDKLEAIRICLESFEGNSLPDFRASISSLFTDSGSTITLSTIHKAKGLENKRVFILRPDKLPLIYRNQRDWQYEQELNLKYVAITRSMESLWFVEPGATPTPEPATQEVTLNTQSTVTPDPSNELSETDNPLSAIGKDALKALALLNGLKTRQNATCHLNGDRQRFAELIDELAPILERIAQ